MLIQSEVESLNILGLHDVALEEVERELETREDASILYVAVCTALSNKRYELAAEYANRLARIPDLEKKDIQIISLAYNYAGQHDEAYRACRDAVFHEGPSMETEFYSLACRAASVGRLEEALIHIIRQLKTVGPREDYLVRKAFIDSELAAVWRHAAESSPDMQRALEAYFDSWSSIVKKNQSLEPERWVDHSDLQHIPQEFQTLLKARCPSTFETPPLKIAQYPELHRRYLNWQAAIASPRVAAFSEYMQKTERLLVDAQPRFAEFQAERHRFGLARTHLLHILRNSRDCDPAILPEIGLLEPLLDEFRAQYLESPEAFRFLVKRSNDFTEEVLATFPPINRSSGLAALYLGNSFHSQFRSKESVEAWIACARIWPWDPTPLLNAVYGLQLAKLFDEASKLLALIGPEALPPATRRLIEDNISNRLPSKNPCRQRPSIPTPSFNGYFPEANADFLDWLGKRNHTAI